MKIGLFTDSYVPQLDGVATSVQAQAKELEKLGHEVYIIAPKYPKFRDKKNVIRLVSVRIYQKPLVRIGLQLPQRSLLKILQIDFDVIHGHSGGPITFLGWQIAQMKKIPYVATYHTLWNRYAHYLLKGAIRPKMLEISSVLFGNVCDCLIAPTSKVKDELKIYGVKKPIHVIPSGIEVDRFEKQKKLFLRKKLQLKKTDKIILSVCRLGKEKSVDFLIKSFTDIYTADPSAYLVLVGEGADKEKLMQLATDLGIRDRVLFTGGIPNIRIPQVYADADIFVFASTTETQGMVILEAMASGVPVVAVSDRAYKEIVQDNVNGYLVRKNTKTFAKQVVTLLNDEAHRRELGANGRKTAAKYSVSNTAIALETVYSELMTLHREDRNSWKEVMSSLNSDFTDLLQRNYRLSRITVNMKEMDRIMSFLKNRFIR